jgi:RluA family pseudouridine synthase
MPRRPKNHPPRCAQRGAKGARPDDTRARPGPGREPAPYRGARDAGKPRGRQGQERPHHDARAKPGPARRPVPLHGARDAGKPQPPRGRWRQERPHGGGAPGQRDKRRAGGHPGAIDRSRDQGALWTPGPNAREVRAEAGQGLAHFLVNLCNHKISVRAARRYLEEGCCRIDGRVETFGSRELKRGEVVEFAIPESHEHLFDARRILYDQQGVLAYDKPAWLAVTPTDGPKSWSLLDILRAELGEVHAVHRLDADTSGIVLFARTAAISVRLEAMFKDHAVKKTYLAIVRGHPREIGLHRSYLVKVESRRGFEKWASGRGANAREAVTSWTVEERVGRYASRLRIEPQTGRTHQIRIHFSELGFPLYGDRLYGDRQDPIQVTRHMLHACRVLLPHPGGGPALDISCQAPREFAEAEAALRRF